MGFEGRHWGKRKMVKESVFISEHFLHRYGFLFTLPGFLCWSFAGGSELIHSTTLKKQKTISRVRGQFMRGIIQMLKNHQPPTQHNHASLRPPPPPSPHTANLPEKKEKRSPHHTTRAEASHSNHRHLMPERQIQPPHLRPSQTRPPPS